MATIIHLVHRYPPAQGGAEQHVRQLGHFLVGRGHCVRVETTTGLTHHSFVDFRAPHLAHGISSDGEIAIRRHRVICWPGQRYLLRALEALPLPSAWQPWFFPWGPLCPGLASVQVADSKKPDIVHAFAFPHGSVIAAAELLARRHQALFVLTPFWHPGPEGPPGDRIRHGFNHPALLQIAQRADLVIAQTQVEKDHLIRWGLKDSTIEVAPPGIDPASVSGGNRTLGRKRWGLPDNAIVVGYLGPICRNKGSVVLLEALGRLQQDNIFGLVAGTVLSDAQSAVAQRSPNTRIVGPLNDAERRDFYASIDLFCLPSVIDSFGLVVLEAWSAGVPCVVAQAGGPGCLVRHGVDGLVVPRTSAIHLETALSEIGRNTAIRTALGEAGRQRTNRDFTVPVRYTHLAERLEALIG